MARLDEIQKIAEQRKKYSKIRKVFLTFACLVVFVTTYMLVLPALTMETELICDKKEHVHDSSCYKVSKELVCDKEEREGHKHSSSCYKTEKVLTCSDESAEHSHSDSCYKEDKKLTCDKDECEGHKHGDSCYKEKKELTCDKDEHTHGDSCYKKKEEATTQEEAAEATTEQAEEASTEEADPGKFDLTAETENDENHAIVNIKGDYKTFDAKAEDISLNIKYSDDEAADQLVVDKYGEEAENIAKIRHYNIRIKDKDNDIDPKDKISVKLAGIALGEDKEKVEIYTLKDGESDLEKVDIELKENGDITFDSKKFAEYEYIIVTHNKVAEEAKMATELTYEDDSIKVVVTLSEEAKIPENAEFKVSKLAEGSVEYAEAEKKVQEYLEAKKLTLEGHVPYDMHIEVDGQEVEPEGKVNVDVTYKKALDIPDSKDKAAKSITEIVIGAKKDETAEDGIKVLHLKEENNKVSVEDLTQEVKVDNKEQVESLSFETDSFSTYSLVQTDTTTGNDWITAGDPVSLNGVLGNAQYYGVVANTINKTGHMDTTFATKKLTGNGNVTCGKDVPDNYAGAYWIGSYSGTGFFIDHAGDNKSTTAIIYCPTDIQNKTNNVVDGKITNKTNNNGFETKTVEEVSEYVDSMISHIRGQSDFMLNQKTTTYNPDKKNNFTNGTGDNKTLDFTGLDDGTYYVDGTFFYGSDISDITLKFNPNQNIVFNFKDKTQFNLKRFTVIYNGTKVEPAKTAAEGNNPLIRDVSKRIYFNLPSCKDLYIDSAICGVVLAPNATLNSLHGTSSGWLVVNTMNDSSSEWHFNYDDMPDVVPVNTRFTAKKTVNDATPSADQVFEFVLDELKTTGWESIDTARNNGAEIAFSTNITYDADSQVGDHWYRITERQTSTEDYSIPSGYTLSQEQYLVKVKVEKVEHKDSNNVVTSVEYKKTETRYRVSDVDHLLKADKTINTAAITQIGTEFVFNNTTSDDKTSISVKKVWKNADGRSIDDCDHADISFKLIQVKENNRSEYGIFTVGRDGQWQTTINNLPKKDQNEIEYRYLLEEINPDSDYTVTYSNNDGILSGTIQIINTRKETSIDIKKVWKNADGTEMTNPPSSITFGVFNGESLVAAFTLHADSVAKNPNPVTEDSIVATMKTGSTWEAKVTGLPVLTSGTYTVKEISIGDVTMVGDDTQSGYTVTVTPSEDGKTFVITNQLIQSYELPHTGGMGTTPFTISGLALLGIAGGMMINNKRKEEE